MIDSARRPHAHHRCVLQNFAQGQSPSRPKVTPSRTVPEYKTELELDRFVIYEDEHHRCCEVQKRIEARNATRKRPSPAWWHGELLRRLKNEKDVYYCYLCEHRKKRQQLFVVHGDGRILNHHEGSHRIDRDLGDRKPEHLPRNKPLSHSFANLCSSCYYAGFKRPEALIINVICAIFIGDPVDIFRVYLIPTSMPTTFALEGDALVI
jgi:hypothetical protein